jgi:hypothetical protein
VEFGVSPALALANGERVLSGAVKCEETRLVDERAAVEWSEGGDLDQVQTRIEREEEQKIASDDGGLRGQVTS